MQQPSNSLSTLKMPYFFVFSTILLPWLNPFSPGPTPAIVPFLFSSVCAAICSVALQLSHRTTQRGQAESVIALAWLIAAGTSSAIGLLQYFGITEWAGLWINHTGLGEAYGNLRQRNQFATLLNIGLATSIYFAHHQQHDAHSYTSSESHLPRVMLLTVTGLLSIGNAASSSRTGLVQLVLLVILAWMWGRHEMTAIEHTQPQRRVVFKVLVIALLTYVLATVVLPWLVGLDPSSSSAWARLRAGDAQCSSRLTLWSNVLHLIAQKPWAGWGWGELDYAHFITLYPGARFCAILDNAHNLPLHLAVELGVPVALLVCGVMIGLVWHARPWRESNPSRQLAWSVLAVIGLHSLLEYPLWYGPFQMATLLSIWILWRIPADRDGAPRPARTSLRLPYVSALTAASLIALCGFSAWNYQLASQIYMAPADRMSMYRENTLEKINNVILFQDQVQFAKLTTTELDAANAQEVHDQALAMLHFSPEERVVEMLLNSCKLLGRTDEISFLAPRYKAAFPEAYANWQASQAKP